MARWPGDTLPEFPTGHHLNTKDGHRLIQTRPGRWRLTAPDETLAAGHVLEVQPGYLVQSKTTTGVWYLVAGKDCSCTAGEFGRDRCVHRAQVAQFVRLLDRAMKRPTTPPATSLLCD
jgi:hypothetical protein